jgi:SAM-dependent methyltransferase
MSQVKRTRARWESLAERYDQPHVRLRQIARLVAAQGPATVLDIGCCRGTLGRLLPPTTSYTGIDFVQPSNASEFDFHRFDLNAGGIPEHLPAFDAITCSGVLEYAESLPSTLQDISAHLRPGGQLIASYFNFNHPKRALNLLGGQTIPMHRDWRGFYALGHLQRLLSHAHLVPSRVYVSTWGWKASPPVDETLGLEADLIPAKGIPGWLAHQFIVVAERT